MLEKIKNLLQIRKKEENISITEKIDNMFDSLNEETIVIKIGSDLVPFGDYICEIVAEVREEIKDECGFILSPVRILDSSCCQENELIITIRDKDAERIFLVPNRKYIYQDFYEGLKSTIYSYIHMIFTNDIAEKYINIVQKNNSWLIWNITNVLSVVDIKKVLCGIINNGKSISNIDYVFELIGEYILTGRNYRDYLVQYNPNSIAKQIAKRI